MRAAIVLCGGQSSRMGTDKCLLPFGDTDMLSCVLKTVGPLADHVVLAGRGRPPNRLDIATDGQLEWVLDDVAGTGPLEGVHTGLRRIQQRFGDQTPTLVVGCDYPLIQSGFVQKLFEFAEGFDAAAVMRAERLIPLPAVYRSGLVKLVAQRRAARQWSLQGILQHCSVRPVTPSELGNVDRDLISLRSANDPDEYQRLLGLRRRDLETPTE